MEPHFLHWFPGHNGLGWGLLIVSQQGPGHLVSPCFYLLAASMIFLPSCHLSSPHKPPFSGDSVFSLVPIFGAGWGLMVWDRLGSVS